MSGQPYRVWDLKPGDVMIVRGVGHLMTFVDADDPERPRFSLNGQPPEPSIGERVDRALVSGAWIVIQRGDDQP